MIHYFAYLKKKIGFIQNEKSKNLVGIQRNSQYFPTKPKTFQLLLYTAVKLNLHCWIQKY